MSFDFAACECNGGHVRNKETGKCVKIADCPGYQSEFVFTHRTNGNRLNFNRLSVKLISLPGSAQDFLKLQMLEILENL